jgi:NitT/TauT family transport system permease protein
MGNRYNFVSICLFILCVLCIQTHFIQLTSYDETIIRTDKIDAKYYYIPNVFGETKTNSQNQSVVTKVKDSANNGSNVNQVLTTKGSNLNWSINFILLAIDALSSIYRMFAALGLSFATAIIFGILAARKPLASKIIIPVIDILQSVPILGFFPAAIAFFITLSNESSIGIEMAAIFLIFTSMVWNMIFSVYESVLSIPSELLETTYAYRANPFLRLRRLYLPASIPKLIYNSIMSWAAGWYFLTAAEIISLGSKTFTLHGLGSLLGRSVSSGQFLQAMVALSMLIVVIMVIDLFFWRPLESYANRFNYDSSSSSAFTIVKSKNNRSHLLNRYNDNIPRLFRNAATFSTGYLSDFLNKSPRPLMHIKSGRLIDIFSKIISSSELQIFPVIHHWFDTKRNLKIFGIILLSISVSLIVLVIFHEGIIIYKSILSLNQMYASLYTDSKSAKIVTQIPLALFLSYLRLAAAYLITMMWTIPVAIKIAHHPRFNHFMFLFQTFAAIPATAFFPFAIAVINYVPGGFEFLSILLILTGMQWYLLFNLIGGLHSMPANIEETARAFRATRGQYIRKVLFPSIYPSFITGSITGWGGGWNALIVAEYLVLGNKTYAVLGIGSLLDRASYDVGNTVLVLLLVGIMSVVIVMINRLIWRQIYKKVVKKYSINT